MLPENGDNEQLEFLGDSILGFIASESLVLRHPAAREGQLSQWKAHLVSATHLHSCALELSLGEYLLLGKGEERNGGRERKTLLANALEAVIAALYIDGGIEVTRGFIEDHILGVLDRPDDVESIGLLNHKSVLQERSQAFGIAGSALFNGGDQRAGTRQSFHGGSADWNGTGEPREWKFEESREPECGTTVDRATEFE